MGKVNDPFAGLKEVLFGPPITFHVSNSPTYGFGFTGWKNVNKALEESDPFDDWVGEVREATRRENEIIEAISNIQGT
jgi:hypothetical protein